MARVTGPLHSIDARGNFAGQFQFRGGKKGVHVYRPMDPREVNQREPSPAQANIRQVYRDAVANWQAIGPAYQQSYNEQALAEGATISGWNLFLRYYMQTFLGSGGGMG